MNWFRVAALITAVSLAISPVYAQKRAITPDDYYAMRAVSESRISPDGKQVVFVITTASLKTNKKTSQLWLVPTESSSPARQITSGSQSSNHPRWKPDGSAIAFLSGRSSSPLSNATKTQVQVLRMDGGEARPITSFNNGVTDFSWSPDGTKLVCVSALGAMDGADVAKTDVETSDTRHYVHPTYKLDGKGFSDNRHEHLWVVEVASGRTKQISQGDDWADTEPEWSPDGAKIAFVSDRTGKAFEGSRQTDIWVIPATGGNPVKVSRHGSGNWNSTGYTPMHQSPHWSDDGKQIAFLGAEDEESTNAVYVTPSDGSAPARLAVKDVDSLTTNIQWHDGAIYYISNHHGSQHLFRADPSNGAILQVTSAEQFRGSLDIAKLANLAVFTANDFQHPNEVFIADLARHDEKQLTSVNQAVLSQLELPAVSRVVYRAEDGLMLEGFLAKPYGWRPGEKYPMILQLHGGPSTMFGFGWSLMFQELAARGWAVFYPNFRGTSGYGPEFLRAIDKEWGGKAYTDVMSGVDAVIAQNPWIDSKRLGVMGASFGGYMTNWIISHTTRFVAAVPMASISDLVSIEGTRDFAYSHTHDFGGDLFQNFDLYWKYSPLHYAANVKTPTLILHGEADHRVPIEQPEEWFRALRHFNVPAEIVMFPREGHAGLLNGEPHHVVETINWATYWFDRYLNQNMAALPPDTVQKRVATPADETAPETN